MTEQTAVAHAGHQAGTQPPPRVRLHFRTQALVTDARGYTRWATRTTEQVVLAAAAAIIICDMWDDHWSRGASERVAALAPRMNQVITAARASGMQIIHAPSSTLAFYANTPARQRVLDAPPLAPPPPLDHPDPPLPLDASDGGSDTGEAPWRPAWSRQHPALEIDQARDGIADDGVAIYRFLRQRGIEQVLIMGVHTNMCVLNRTFGIKALVRWGLPVALVRDLTDALYNPARSPYVSHDAGTRLIIAYIEKFWCPTIASTDLLGASDHIAAT
jgi:nicotinamidase-related amidase